MQSAWPPSAALSYRAFKSVRHPSARHACLLIPCLSNEKIPLAQAWAIAYTRPQPSQRRHASTRRSVSSAAIPTSQNASVRETSDQMPSALACLPLNALIRSYIITSVSAYPFLLRPSLAVLSRIARSKSRLLDPDSSPILKYVLKRTFYAQFCAGETPSEVRISLDNLRQMGFAGVILAHAKEVVLEGDEAKSYSNSHVSEAQKESDKKDVSDWEESTTDTVQLSQPGDYVALKFTGAGRQSIQHLLETIACDPALEQAIDRICQLAKARGVRLLFDAEQARLQEGIDNWTMHFMKRYNKGEKALVYGTYQAYAKKTPLVLARHLEEAKKHNFVLGVKLVRGAYLGSDPRELFWPTIEDTHKCYNGIAESLIKRQYGEVLKPAEGVSGQFPRVDFVLASHNAKSVELARQLRDEQARTGQPRIELAYGQLMGMADNVSCELVQSARERTERADQQQVDVPRAYKYLVWGKVSECLKYLLRRAHENRDAVTRTSEARQALGHELMRRMRLVKK